MPVVFDKDFLSHRGNLDQKHLRAKNKKEKALVKDAAQKYRAYVRSIDWDLVVSGEFDAAVTSLDEYVLYAKSLESSDKLFNWRSDYAGSIIPEFLYMAIHALACSKKISALFSTRKSVVELTLTGEADVGFGIRRKNQDLSIGLSMHKIVTDSKGAEEEFLVPVVVTEVKTNTDINKLSGLGFSAERLKRTFPGAAYLLVTETIDFSLKENYASSDVDQAYVLRKQLRSAARRQGASLQPDVVKQYCDDVMGRLQRASEARGHVYARLESGKLINV